MEILTMSKRSSLLLKQTKVLKHGTKKKKKTGKTKSAADAE
jgi:hypothetical protein